MQKTAVAILLLTFVFAGTSAYAEQSDGCDGVISILRISNYVEAGTEEGLREASSKHDAWYKSHGVKDNEQVVIPLFKYDRDTDTWTKDRKRVSTLHLNSMASANAREHQGDSAWDEFISLYNKNTEVTETLFACLPRSLFSE